MGNAAVFADVRVCVVDDNRNFQNLFRTLLRGLGVRRVDLFGDPDEATAFVTATPVDITFIDLVMPRQNGIEWIARTRRAERLANPTMPIALVSGHVDRRVLEAAVRAGVDDILVKPLSPATLFDHIRRLLRHPIPYVRGADGYFGPDTRLLTAKPKPVEAPVGQIASVSRAATGRKTYARAIPGLDVERRREPVYDSSPTFLD
ncbi:MAG: response regulator [Siculibacillus sp.]|nr:response regulator [Siculibacillus sp.]